MYESNTHENNDRYNICVLSVSADGHSLVEVGIPIKLYDDINKDLMSHQFKYYRVLSSDEK